MIIIVSIIIVCCILVLMILQSPFTFTRVSPGINYRVGQNNRTIPNIEIKGKRVYLLKRKVLQDMGGLLNLVHEVLEKNGIPYWVTCGTLLGCIRHQGFIPWDDDIDINVELEYADRLEKILSGMASNGYILCPARGGFKFGYNNFACYPFVDIIIVNNKNNVLQPCYPLDKNGECTYEVGRQWPDECFAVADVYPLLLRTFEDFQVYVPHNYESLLHKIYGNDCLYAAGTRSNVPYAYSLKTFPWLMNHYYDNILFRLGLHKG